MKVAQTLKNLKEQIFCLLLWKPFPFLETLIKIAAWAIFEAKNYVISTFDHIEHINQSRMVNCK